MLPEIPALIVIDPLRDVHGAEENESGPMADVMDRLRSIRDIVGCAVLFVHHLGKASRDNQKSRAGQRMRGSSVIHGSVEGTIALGELKGDRSTYLESTVDVELKAGQGAGVFMLRLDIIDDPVIRQAVSASWTFGRPDRGAEESAKLEGVVLAAVEALGAAAAPMSVAAIREALGMGSDAVRSALNLAAIRGLARKALQGKRDLGWELVPSLTDPDSSLTQSARDLEPDPDSPPIGGVRSPGPIDEVGRRSKTTRQSVRVAELGRVPVAKAGRR